MPGIMQSSATKISIIAIIAVIIVAVAYLSFIVGSNNGVATTTSPQSTISSPNQSSNSSQTAFNGSQYQPYSYQIFPKTSLSSSGSFVTADLNLTNTAMADGSEKVTIAFRNSNLSYTLNVKPDEVLYYIDLSSSDDAGASGDHFIQDDGYVLVNGTTGRIVRTVFPFQ